MEASSPVSYPPQHYFSPTLTVDLDDMEWSHETRLDLSTGEASEDGEPFSFDIPPCLKQFAYFTLLPQELQDRIWAAAIPDPGIHFLRVHGPAHRFAWVRPRLGVSPPWSVRSSYEDVKAEMEEEARYERRGREIHCTLQPLAADPRADKSQYMVVASRLSGIAQQDAKARRWVDFVREQPRPLKLTPHDGRATILASNLHRDVVFLEYLDDSRHRTDHVLAVHIVCPDLDRIRRVAFRYCHEWKRSRCESRSCPGCGRIHSSRVERGICPHHLYQFLGRHLPHLEEVWLVDYLMLPREPTRRGGSPGPPDAVRRRRRFHARDRVFYEADPDTWEIRPAMTDVADWIREHYVRYVRASELCHHADPSSVRFGFLGCR
ncbi:hypothetical protein GMORB2_1525 [Geosmithia morbida]|uniref:Uncharacterized protein n=1 Tax=Geosmithia morbida TaxID=1094350 RepID=A0A9P4YRB7_9HYPO|nr:uncharacterized protein GMORB2_1525 [Geosmithia morbida]KAF4121686.1 hypothetical protein GMORB2_1525 [Geosmithia morbida]